jgi:hypothetical protein
MKLNVKNNMFDGEDMHAHLSRKSILWSDISNAIDPDE